LECKKVNTKGEPPSTSSVPSYPPTILPKASDRSIHHTIIQSKQPLDGNISTFPHFPITTVGQGSDERESAAYSLQTSTSSRPSVHPNIPCVNTRRMLMTTSSQIHPNPSLMSLQKRFLGDLERRDGTKFHPYRWILSTISPVGFPQQSQAVTQERSILSRVQ